MSWGCAEIMSGNATKFRKQNILVSTDFFHLPRKLREVFPRKYFSMLYLLSSLSYFLEIFFVIWLSKSFARVCNNFFCTLKQLNVEKNKTQIAKSDAKWDNCDFAVFQKLPPKIIREWEEKIIIPLIALGNCTKNCAVTGQLNCTIQTILKKKSIFTAQLSWIEAQLPILSVLEMAKFII